jgi:hypothetical protein
MPLMSAIRGGARAKDWLPGVVGSNSQTASKLQIYQGSDLARRYDATRGILKSNKKLSNQIDGAHEAFAKSEDALAASQAAYEKAHPQLVQALETAAQKGDTAGMRAAMRELRGTDEYQNFLNQVGMRQAERQNIRGLENQAYQNYKDSYGKYPGMIKDYMLARDFKGKDGRTMALAQRWGVAGAGWMGMNMAGRAVTGGSFAYNNQGERDIAGIPFI